MDLKNLEKLSQKTNQDLINCELKIENWVKFKNDYKALEERLETIADKTTHEIMVPIGGSDIAFMPGFIKHTNEILVLLGENYFVERSAKQAIDIVKRRLNNCNQMIDNLNKEKEQIQNWLSFSQMFFPGESGEDLVEINEEYDEEKEKLWREEHNRKMKAYKQELAKNREPIIEELATDSNISEKFEKLEIEEKVTKNSEPKSILKKKSSSQELLKLEKCVSFEEKEESVLIVNEEESHPLIKFQQKTVSESKPKICEISENAFKNQVIERVVDSGNTGPTAAVESPPRLVSRFKASRLKK